MSATRREIHYRPSSGQSPKLRDLPIREQWAWLDSFFSRCTDSRPFAMDATLQVHVEDLEHWAASNAITEATRLFGKPKYERDLIFPDDATWEWEIGVAAGTAAIDFVAQGEPWGRHGVRPVSIVFMTLFNLRDPTSGNILPHQASPAEWSMERTSSMIGGIGPLPWHNPRYVFPFERVDHRFLKYLAAFTDELPYRLAPRHFRSVRPATDDSREHLGFLSPEDDARIRQAQVGGSRPSRPPTRQPRRRG